MAKDLNTSNLSIVAEEGALKVVSINGEARLGAVYLDGKRLEGVYAELDEGALLPAAASGGEQVGVPTGVKGRDAYLKKWAAAAKKSSKAKKGATSSVLLLSLAACGGGGGDAPAPAVVVFSPEFDSDGDASVSITSGTVGTVIQIASKAPGKDVYDLAISGSGSGILTIDFAEAADEVIISSASNLSGFHTIVVVNGTADFTSLGLGVLKDTVFQIGSGAVVTYAQFLELTSVNLRTGASEGTFTVEVTTNAQALDVQNSSKVGDDVTIAIVKPVPAAPTVETVAGDNIINASEAGDGVVVSGSAEIGSTVTVKIGGSPKEVVVGDDGEYSVTFAAGDLPADGDYTVEVTVTDVLGQISQTSELAISIDTQNPGVTDIDASGALDTSSSAEDFIIVGAEAGSGALTLVVTYGEAMDKTVAPIIAFSPSVASTLTFASGSWDSEGLVYTAIFDVADADVEVSSVDVTISGAKDLAGNLQAEDSFEDAFTIDTKAPTAAITLSDSALKIGETSTVTITFSEAVTALSTMTSSDNGVTWTGVFTPTGDIEDTSNVISLAATYTDVAGNAGAVATSANYTVDTKAPTAAITLSDSALKIGETSTVTITFSEAVTVTM